MSAILETSGLVAGYGEVEILHGVSISVEAGKMIAVIGPNGAGKSTLLKTIFGLVPTRQGGVRFNGADITNEPTNRIVAKGISYVPQTENVFPSLSINENLEMGAFIRRNGLRERLEHVYAIFPDLAGRRGDGVLEAHCLRRERGRRVVDALLDAADGDGAIGRHQRLHALEGLHGRLLLHLREPLR